MYLFIMKSVPIAVLKRHLAAMVDEAAKGERLVITRHNQPLAYLSAVDSQAVHVGRRFGKASLAPALRRATSGRYLRVLEEDRADER